MIMIATTILRWTMVGGIGCWIFRWCGGDLREWVGDELGRLEGTVEEPGGGSSIFRSV